VGKSGSIVNMLTFRRNQNGEVNMGWQFILTLIVVTVMAAVVFFIQRQLSGGGRSLIRFVVTSVVLAALLTGGALLVSNKRARVAAAPTPTSRPTPVRVARSVLGNLEESRTFLGRALPWQTAELAAQIMAKIVDIPVREGDKVRCGDILIALDGSEIQSNLAAAEAQIAEAEARVEAQQATVASLAKTAEFWERERERDLELARNGAIAQAAADATTDRYNEARGRLEAGYKVLDAAAKQVESLRHRYREIQTRLEYAVIRSPFNGFIVRRWEDPGNLAVPGKPILTVEDHSRWRIAFDIPQEDLDHIRAGTTVRLTGRGLELRVNRLYPSLNPDRTRTVEAYAAGDLSLQPGTFHSLEVPLRRFENRVLIPESAILRSPDGGHGTFTVTDGVIAPVRIEVLAIRDGIAAVDGLKPGTPVVLSTYLGWNRLAAGQTVEVIQ